MNRKQRRALKKQAQRQETSHQSAACRDDGFDPVVVKYMEIEVARKIAFIDQLVAIKEDFEEIEGEVKSVATDASIMFFGWLRHRGIDDGVEVIASMSKHFVELTYLGFFRRRPTLHSVSKRELMEFINHLEFAVTREQWEANINPFDGLLLFFRFLEESGYPSRLKTRQRALNQLRRAIIKLPVENNLANAVEIMQ